MDLQPWCCRLVEYKYFLDDKRKAINELEKKNYTTNSIPPFIFARRIIPFFILRYSKAPEILYVDPNLVIGATVNKYSENSIKKCNEINSDYSGSDAFNTVEYERIGNLPLYIAYEGKNRVRLFQEHQIKIKARVNYTYYPSPNELQLQKSMLNNDYYLSCSNEFFVQNENNTILLLYPEITVPLFKSYGVKEGKSIKGIYITSRKRLLAQKDLESKEP